MNVSNPHISNCIYSKTGAYSDDDDDNDEEKRDDVMCEDSQNQ